YDNCRKTDHISQEYSKPRYENRGGGGGGCADGDRNPNAYN
ncbi:unnamed protein product, partial [Rotaria sp. Silwood1]